LFSRQACAVEIQNAAHKDEPGYVAVTPDEIEIISQDQLDQAFAPIERSFDSLFKSLGSAKRFGHFFISSLAIYQEKRLGLAQLLRFLVPS